MPLFTVSGEIDSYQILILPFLINPVLPFTNSGIGELITSLTILSVLSGSFGPVKKNVDNC